MYEHGYGYKTDDGLYDEEAHARDVRHVWKCPGCQHEFSAEPGVNENIQCSCGRFYERAGEEYGDRRW